MRVLLLSVSFAVWNLAVTGSTASLRGIHNVGGGVIWASGSSGTVLRSEDAGYMWQTCKAPPDADKLDFRGVFGWDANHVDVMSSGTGAASRLYETTDGCATWQLLFENPDRDGFWDALAFRGNSGFILGDPVDGRFVLYRSDDLGHHWHRDNSPGLTAAPGEGVFAASNSSLVVLSNRELVFATGGTGGPRVFRSKQPLEWTATKVPIAGGTESSGIFSIAFRDAAQGVVVGGDYKNPTQAAGTAAWTSDGGVSWHPATAFPSGFRSSVAWDSKINAWIAAGTNGSDISRDNGRTWKQLDSGNWNALSLPWAAGPKGRIASLNAASPSILTSGMTRTQDPVQAAREWRIQHQAAILDGFSALLSIPNVAADPVNLRRNADTLVTLLRDRHFDAHLVSIPDAAPVVFGERRVPGAKHTFVFYAHYDGQPVTPSEWDTPPFKPTLRMVDGEQRIYARSAGDDKAAIYAQLMALDALDAAHIALRSNIRFVWEGEEEAGSPHLEQILDANRDLVHGDVWLVCDGPVDQSRQQTLVFGARGDAHLEITVYGPNRGLHSGHYGNWAPNPAMMLAQLLAGMKDDEGRVLIPHFYDGIVPLSNAEKQALARAPVNDDKLREELALGHVDGGGAHLLELLNLPSLNINGISSGQTGTRATNVIPSTATVDLDLRLVAGVDWRQQQDRVVDYIRSRGYFVVDSPPDHATLLAHPKVALVKKDTAGYNAVRTPMDLPIAAEVLAAVEAARGKVIEWPTMGGSVPLGAMERAASTRTITVPIANHDDNQHAANENLRLQNLWDGIETMASLLYMQ